MTLEERVNAYGKIKTLADAYKKDADAQNKQLKKCLEDLNVTDYSTDYFKVTYYTQTRESMNEDKALEILKRAGVTQCVKTVEVLDTEALESLLYNGELSKDVISQLNECRITKKTPALKIVSLEAK